MAKVLQLVNRPESRLDLLKIDGQSIPILLLDGPAGAPIIPAVLQGNIFIDPQNSTGNASDANPGTSTAPFLSYAGVVKVWGTTRPLLTVATALIFMSNSPAQGDPVIFEPYVQNNVLVGIQGNVAPAIAVALAGVTPKNRTLGSNSALSATYSAATAVGFIVVNATHPSVAWTQRALGANAFQTTQPMVTAAGPGSTSQPAEVDTWANADNVTVGALVSVNLIRFAPLSVDAEGAGTGGFLYRINIAPNTGGSTPRCTLDATGGGIRLIESSNTGYVLIWAPDTIANGGSGTSSANCFWGAPITCRSSFFPMNGGALNGAQNRLERPTFDGDIIIGGSTQVLSTLCNFGFVFVDAGVTLQLFSSQGTIGTVAYGGSAIYAGAAGEIIVQGNGRLVKPAGTWVANVTAPQMVTGISLNGSRTGVSHTGAAPDVFNGGIATTPANLDAAAGAAGFGGNALSMQLGGASTSNAA